MAMRNNTGILSQPYGNVRVTAQPRIVFEDVDDPEARCWMHLSMYCEPETAHADMVRRHGALASRTLAARSAAWYRQAREFFAAAKVASLATWPTLLYYGQLNLAKATYATITNLAPSPWHGMVRDSNARILGWAAGFKTSGAIQSFAELHGVRVSETAPRNGRIAVRTTVCDLLRREENASRMISSFLGQPPLVFHCARPEYRSIFVRTKQRMGWLINLEEDPANNAIPKIVRTNTFFEFSHGFGQTTLLARRRAELGYEQTTSFSSIITPTLKGQAFWWPGPVRQLALGWMLSEISRYSPELLSASASASNRRLLPVLEIAMQDIQRSFPNECLNLLYGARMSFVSPSPVR